MVHRRLLTLDGPGSVRFLRVSSEQLESRTRAVALANGELIQAGVKRVVHEVVNAIGSRVVRTAIFVARTSTGGSRLDRGVINKIARVGARVTLEDMEKIEPVADLVNGGKTEVVVGCGAARQRVARLQTAIHRDGAGRRGLDGEGAEAQQHLVAVVCLEVAQEGKVQFIIATSVK